MKKAIFLLFLASNSWGAVDFVNTNTHDRQLTTAYSGVFTVNAGLNLAAVACVGLDNSAGLSITNVTLGGFKMTQAGTTANNGNAYAAIFVLPNPPVGTPTLAVTASAGTNDIYANVVVFSGVDQLVPVRPGTAQSVTGTSLNPAITMRSEAGDKTFTCLTPGPANVTNTSQTSNGFNITGTMSAGSDRETATTQTVVHTWTTDGSQPYALAGISLQPPVHPPLNQVPVGGF